MNHAALALSVMIGLSTTSALAQPRDPSAVVTRQVSTTEGQPVLVRNYAMWRPDCTPRGEPVVAITAQPQHGTVTVRPGMSTIREYASGAGECVGRQVPGLAVWYQPFPGYHGPDQFGVTINMVHVLHDMVMVTVR